MKILLAGAWQFSVFQKACADALTRQGITVVPFAWGHYFSGLAGRAQHRFPLPGPALMRLNHDLIKTTEAHNPDCIVVWRGTHILPETLRTLKRKTGAVLVSYNNDDPFGTRAHGHASWHQRFYWHHYLNAVPEYDVHFVFRPVNVPEILEAGAKEAHVLMPYFIPEDHRPIALTAGEISRYGCDVVFVGHYEPDGRVEYLRRLVQSGLHVRLFGGNTWTRTVLRDLSDYFGQVQPAVGDEYAKALCGAQMCLCFLSKLNRDAYTFRCFEIPACGGLLLSERSDDLCRLFKEDRQAVYFTSPEELVNKALWLRDHKEDADRIATAGMCRVHDGSHSVNDRMSELLYIIEKHR